MSRTQEYRTLALALLLPLYIRSTTLPNFTLHAISTIIATTLHLILYRKPLPINTAASILIALAWSWCANQIADFVVRGEWVRLLLAYLISLDGMGWLLPWWLDAREGVAKVRQRGAGKLVLVVPMVVAFAVATGLRDRYNDDGRVVWRVLDMVMVGCVSAAGMQRLVVMLWNAGCRSSEKGGSDVVLESSGRTTKQGAMTEEWIPEIVRRTTAQYDRRGTPGNRPADWRPPRPVTRRRG